MSFIKGDVASGLEKPSRYMGRWYTIASIPFLDEREFVEREEISASTSNSWGSVHSRGDSMYEIDRVGYWISEHGMAFSKFGQTGFEYLLMVGIFAVRVVAEVVFQATAPPLRRVRAGSFRCVWQQTPLGALRHLL